MTDAALRKYIEEKMLPFVTRPGRYIGNEINTVIKDTHKAAINIALVFPDVYEVGMSHLGSKLLYTVIHNRYTDVVAERVYAPWHDMEELLRHNNCPLFSLETYTPVKDFDIVGFSLQHEMINTNVLNILDLSGIPLFSSQRDACRFPLVIAGGAGTFSPEPMAAFIDLFVIGDGEEALCEIIDCLKASGYPAQKDSLRRKDILREIVTQVEGIYVPELYDVSYDSAGVFQKIVPVDAWVPPRVKKRTYWNFIKEKEGAAVIVPLIEAVHDRGVIEIARGCTRGCRFCQAGMLCRPLREKDESVIVEQALTLEKKTGYEEISLLSLSACDYSRIESLVDTLLVHFREKRIGISIPSLRADSFSMEIAKKIKSVRKTGLTFAPEAGSDRLRLLINKKVSQENLLTAVEESYRLGWRLVKLYFMLGLPTEEASDVEEIINLIYKVSNTRRRVDKQPGRVNVSIASFVPKAHTPFQWEKMCERTLLAERQEHIRNRIKSKYIKLKFHDIQLSYLEAIFARGDRRLSSVLYEAWRSGCVFDNWTECFDFDAWKNAFNAAGIDPDSYMRERAEDKPLPWDHIDTGVSKEFLKKERACAYRHEETQDCRTGLCYKCGVCGVTVR